MTDEKEAIRHRMAQARESLSAAELLIDHQLYTAAVNRLYYACFYAASALLLEHGYSAKTHAGLRSLFSQHVIHAGLLPDEYGVLYNNLLEAREDADYDEFIEPNPETTRNRLPGTKRFIDAVEQLIPTDRK